MKQLVFKKLVWGIKVRLNILKLGVYDQFMIDIAYKSQNWSNVISTLLYTLSFAGFVVIVFDNIDTLAGYTQNEMMLFLLISQFAFYIEYAMARPNIENLNISINEGYLDLMLTKPLPILYYVIFNRVRLLNFLTEGLPTLAVLAILAIDWSQLSFDLVPLMSASIVFLSGLYLNTILSLLAVMPAFWSGYSKELTRTVSALSWFSRREIPLEGLPESLQKVLLTFIPTMVVGGLTTSVILEKSDALNSLITVAVVTLIFHIIMQIIWKAGLRAYTSASS